MYNLIKVIKDNHYLNYKLGTLVLPDSRFSSHLATVGLHVLLAIYIGLECFLAIGTHERSLLLGKKCGYGEVHQW